MTENDHKEAPSSNDKKGTPSKGRWTRVLLLGAGLLALAASTLYGWHYWTVGRYFQSTNDAYLRADQVTISPRVSGYIAEVYVIQNQNIKGGDRLFRIDERTFQVRVEQAAAELDEDKANEAEASAELARQQAQIEESKAQLAVSEANLKFTQLQEARYRPLATSGAEPSERYDQARNQRDQSEAQVALNAAQLDAAKRMIPSLEARLAQTKAAEERAQAQLHQAQIDLDDTTVSTPVAGRVGDLTARVGQYAESGSRMMSVVPIQDLYLEANYKETQIGLMRIGQPAIIKVDALPQETLHGTLLSLSPGTGSEFSIIPPQNATGNFTKVVQRIPVRVKVDAGPEARKILMPGLSIEVQIDTRSAKGFVEQEEQESEHSRKDGGAK